MRPFSDAGVAKKFDTYPDDMRERLLELREIVFDVAEEANIENLKEVLKWNEPGYTCKNGSTLRMDWKKAKPDHYSLFFNCNTKLISTFRKLFGDRFTFVGNREIAIKPDEPVDMEALRSCILLALTYHKRKHLELLGASTP